MEEKAITRLLQKGKWPKEELKQQRSVFTKLHTMQNLLKITSELSQSLTKFAR